jgi:hypothetical protein
MLETLKGEKTSVLGYPVKRQNLELNVSSPHSAIDSFMNVHTRSCPLFYIQVPLVKAKEMQYTGGLLSTFVQAMKETDYAPTRKPHTAYGIHKRIACR